MQKILVADNNSTSLKIMTGILEKEYEVVPASKPAEAARIIDSGDVELAVLDLRLTDDSDEDISGLDVAKNTNAIIPKLIVTKFGSKEEIRKALGANVDGLPIVIDFLAKNKLAHELVPAVRRALEIKKTRFRRAQERIDKKLEADYRHARRSAQFHTWTSFALSIVFALPIVVGVYSLHLDRAPLAMVFIFIGSLGAEITNYIFARKVEFLYQRVDKFHKELLQAAQFEQLMAGCEEIEDGPERRQFRIRVLEAARARWIGTFETNQPPADTAT
jgi:CheY-like chemotaxis protein